MFHIGGNKSTATYGAVIDVGSGSVGVGIVESDHTKALPKIIYTHRELMRVSKKKVDRAEKIRQMREALFSASLTLSTDGLMALAAHNKHARIKRILVTCSSPWAHTVSKKVSYNADKDKRVTDSLIKNLVKDAEEEIEENLDESTMLFKLGMTIVERATVNVSINGYTVNNPIDLKGKEIELSHITGLIPQEILDAIHEVQDKILNDTKITAHTFMLVNYCIIRDIFPNIDSFCIVDVTGESTEIGVVENNVLLEVRHAPYGTHTLLRDTAKLSSGTAENSLTLLRNFAEGTSSNAQIKSTKAYIAKYLSTVSKTFTDLHKTRKIPKTLVITSLPQLETFYKRTLPSIAETATDKEYTALDFSKEITKEILPTEEMDVYISLASRFFHKLHGCGEIDTL